MKPIFIAKSTLLFILLTFLAMNVLSSIPVVAAQELPREEMFVITATSPTTITGSFNPLTPGYSRSGASANLGILEPLYLCDTITLEFIPWLAADLPTWIDDYTLEITLKDEVYWHDGEPFTSQDVKYTYDLPGRGIFSTQYVDFGQLWAGEMLSSIEAVDDLTVRFHLNQTNPNLVRALFLKAWSRNTVQILPEHIFAQAEIDMDAAGKTIYDFLFDPMVGTGPYKIMSWSSDRAITERWDDWWGKTYFGRLPEPKYCAWIQGTSNEDALRKMIEGSVDYEVNMVPKISQLRTLYGIQTWFLEPPYFAPADVFTDGYGFNLPQMEARFGKEYAYAIRYAIGYAINRESLNKAAFFDTGSIMTDPSLVLPGSAYAFLRDEELLADYTFSYDPTRAKQILDDAGITVGTDGIRELPNGTKVTLTALSVEGWTDWMAALEYLRSYCNAIGIAVTTRTIDMVELANTYVLGEGYDAFAMKRGEMDVSGYYSLLQQFDMAEAGWGPIRFTGNTGNAMHYSNEELNDLKDQIGAYANPLDPSVELELKAIASEVQEILCTDLPVIPIRTHLEPTLFTEKYWTGWPTAENPYMPPIGPNGRLLLLLNLKSVTGPVEPEPPPPIPAGLEETINATYLAVSALQSAVSALQTAVSDLTPSLSALNQISTLTNVVYVNTALIVVLIVVVIYLAVRKTGRAE